MYIFCCCTLFLYDLCALFYVVVLVACSETISTSTASDPTPSLSSSISCTSSKSGLLSGSNFDIPTNWRPETQSCINHKVLNKECRSDIVRTLVTLTIAKVGSKPSRSHCQQVARKLILQYPFMKDDIGDGYVSC